MKLALFYSSQSQGFLNHCLRLSGFLTENPNTECVWFDLNDHPPCSDYALGKYDKFVLLAEKKSLSSAAAHYLSSHRLPIETLPVDYAQKIKPRFFSHCEERWVFCASEENDSSWNQKVWQCANENVPTLYLSQDQEVLEKGASPGPMTFFSPLAAQFHQDAITNATVVISSAWEPCLAARASGKTAIKLSQKASDQNPWGIPEVVISKMSAGEVSSECRRLVQAEQELKRQVLEKNSPTLRADSVLHLTSISDFSYLPFYLGMIENVLRETQQGVKFHLLALDGKVGAFLEDKYPGLVHVLELKDVWSPSELKEIEKRSTAFRAFSSKPRLLEKVLREFQGPTFHCDSDVYFFSPPENLLETFSTGHTVLFPHWNDVYPKGREDGLYNAGIVGVRRGAEGFLKWWGDQCLSECSFNPEKGIVGDQAYLDFAPILFEGVTVYKKRDHNVARWNLDTLGIRLSSDRTALIGKEGRKVQTFHAAFIDSRGFFEFKFCWDQLVTFFSGYALKEASSAFLKNTLVQQQRHWLSLSRAFKGREICHRIFPLLGEASESKAPLFWMQGLGGILLHQALKWRDALWSRLPFSARESTL